MARHNELGKWGEELAVERLGALGFSIEERNWRMGRHEIDIIARKDELIVVAEVKTRSERDTDPLEAVDKRRIQSMVRAAEAYLGTRDTHFDVRFDLFAINGSPDDYSLEHVPDAFFAPLRTYR